jgi:hypothetical protein
MLAPCPATLAGATEAVREEDDRHLIITARNVQLQRNAPIPIGVVDLHGDDFNLPRTGASVLRSSHRHGSLNEEQTHDNRAKRETSAIRIHAGIVRQSPHPPQ